MRNEKREKRKEKREKRKEKINSFRILQCRPYFPMFACLVQFERTSAHTQFTPLEQLFLSLTGSDFTNKGQNTENVLF